MVKSSPGSRRLAPDPTIGWPTLADRCSTTKTPFEWRYVPAWRLKKSMQREPRDVGRLAVARVGHHERVREVRVRAVDEREVTLQERRERQVERVQDPHGPGGHAARLEGDALVLECGGGDAHAQAAVHAEGRVLLLEGRLVNGVDAAVAVVQVHLGGHQAGREE